VHDPQTFEARGMALRYARFTVEAIAEHDEQDLVIADGGFAVAREHVRVASVIDPPDRIPTDAKWIHVDLREQTLVAYEGRQPVLATLISGGTEGFEAPLGVFRVHKKHVTRTMAGPDPDAGRYEVAEVPWTLYYWGSYALHGAYWHDDFGNVRSHGCTNIPPRDARWLFYWSEPDLPRGWHATFGRLGPWLYFTN
jgi:lipoprotein-anchoring transpeptidase ErfK/SrfK